MAPAAAIAPSPAFRLSAIASLSARFRASSPLAAIPAASSAGVQRRNAAKSVFATVGDAASPMEVRRGGPPSSPSLSSASDARRIPRGIAARAAQHSVVAATAAAGDAASLPEALLFDCDGVLVDTERDGHRVSFNQAFEEEMGASGREPFAPWGAALRGELLSVGSCSPWGAALRGELLSVGSCSPWGAALRGELLSVGSCSPWGAALRGELLSVGSCSPCGAALRGEVLCSPWGGALRGEKGLGVTWDVPLYGELLNAALSSFSLPSATLLCSALLCSALLCSALLCSAVLRWLVLAERAGSDVGRATLWRAAQDWRRQGAAAPTDPAEQAAFVAGLHKSKTAHFNAHLHPPFSPPIFHLTLASLPRMTHYFNQVGWPQAAPIDPSERAAFVAGLHKSKTALFMQLVETGALPLRPGVARARQRSSCSSWRRVPCPCDRALHDGALHAARGDGCAAAATRRGTLVETGVLPLQPGVVRWQCAGGSVQHILPTSWGNGAKLVGAIVRVILGSELIDEALAAGVRVAVCSTSNEKAVGAIALAAGVRVAVCSTSNEKAVGAIVRVMLGEERAQHMRIFAGDVVPKKKPDPGEERGFSMHMRIFARDVVPKKKPDPAIYNLAATTLSLNPARCVVIEDSHIGLTAAKAAGMTCVLHGGRGLFSDACLTPLVTHMTRTLCSCSAVSPTHLPHLPPLPLLRPSPTSYTEDEDFSAADAVFDAIGDTPADGFDLPFLASLL
ncbi:unnamed protein product [Closterium sp. NIES-65]|nr:unnamed protein product [Closterium sp. NIES-65]